MSIWKITDEGPARLPKTKLEQEKLLEKELENWVIRDPSLLDESLMVIGRQVRIPDVGDSLDILALDPQGKAVIIELKRGELTDPVDMQALRYAGYISKWEFEDFENQARKHLGKSGDPDFNFNEEYETFCAGEGIDEPPDLNPDQRLIIVGSEVREKLGNVALWLRNHGIDIKVIEIEVYQDSGTLFVRPNVIVPLPVSRFKDVGRTLPGEVSQPWVTDGRGWHLEQRCTPQTREMLLKLNDIIGDNFPDIDGPAWNQKDYVAHRVGNYNWLAAVTHAKSLEVLINVEAGVFNQAKLATRLGVRDFDEARTLAEKFGLPSSVSVENINNTRDRINFRIKNDFDLEGETFVGFLKEAYAASPR